MVCVANHTGSYGSGHYTATCRVPMRPESRLLLSRASCRLFKSDISHPVFISTSRHPHPLAYPEFPHLSSRCNPKISGLVSIRRSARESGGRLWIAVEQEVGDAATGAFYNFNDGRVTKVTGRAWRQQSLRLRVSTESASRCAMPNPAPAGVGIAKPR